MENLNFTIKNNKVYIKIDEEFIKRFGNATYTRKSFNMETIEGKEGFYVESTKLHLVSTKYLHNLSKNQEPSQEEYAVINYPAYSFNSINKKVNSTNYSAWKKSFPYNELKTKEYWENKGVDFTKPIKLYLIFDLHVDRISGATTDIDNCIKSIQDILWYKPISIKDKRGIYGENDNCVAELNVKRGKDILLNSNATIEEKIKAGCKIYYYIKNVD